MVRSSPATISATPLTDEEGRYVGFVGSIIDETERNARETERQMLSALVEHSPDFIGVAGLDLRAVFVNRAGQKLFGIASDEEVKGSNVLDYFAEEERALASERLLPALVEKGQLEFETYARNFATGAKLPIFCTCFVIPDTKTGEPAFVAAVARDIRERKKMDRSIALSCATVLTLSVSQTWTSISSSSTRLANSSSALPVTRR